ncbi:FAD-dependent monooxygenase [Novosphingobium resinovorum]|uniref:FAD-dependent monooxygenase n=1 Tax=Novosphingobium resinovorum TaxID=158500 RepID=UPI002ED3580E|nr:FAD-dependent monooxygenase [Novosphingobium resinovorum]
MQENRNVLIVGGGMGGMACALALHGAGLSPEIVEIDPAWNALGAGLTLNGGALRAFASLGLLDAVKAAGFASVGPVRACDAQGNVLSEGPTAPIFGPGIPNMGGILRPRLHEVMRSAVEAAGIAVRTGVSITAFEEREDSVRATGSDGLAGDYRFVVGADGLFSATRALIFPDAPRPRFTGQGCWRAVVPRPADVTATWVYSGEGCKAGFNPISQDLMYVYLLESAPGNPWIDQADWLELLRARLLRFGGHVKAIAEGLNAESLINYRPLEVVLLSPPWHKGRVLLVGDAVHATTPHVGYGAGMAIEDAAVLGELAGGIEDVETLFTTFTARRYERCRTILEGSVAIGELEMAEAPVAEQRALSARISRLIQEPI